MVRNPHFHSSREEVCKDTYQMRSNKFDNYCLIIYNWCDKI